MRIPNMWISFSFALVLGCQAPLHAQGETKQGQPLPASTTDDVGYVYIRQRVSADYNGSPDKLARALVYPVEKQILIKSGDTLSGIISNEYQVGPSNAPTAYQLFKKSILDLNRISPESTLQANTILKIPNLPPMALARPNPGNKLNRIPKLGIQSNMLSGRTNVDSLSSVPSSSIVFDEGRKGAQEVVMVQRVTRAYALQLMQNNPGQAQVINDLINIEFARAGEEVGANASQQITNSFISSVDESVLREKLKGVARKRPILVVLDDTWPDETDFAKSRKFFLDAIIGVRQHYMLGSPDLSKSALVMANFIPNDEGQGRVTHASQVKRALLPLQALEPEEGRVSVVFLPLFRGDPISAELFTQLIEIDLDTKHMGAALGFDAVPMDVIAANRKIAEQIVQGISSKMSNAVPATDQALVAAVLNFLSLYSNYIMQPSILNMSWTTPNLAFPIEVPEDGYGLNVVAAGNEGDDRGTTVYQLHRQFASRSLTPPGDMLAVMNVRDDGSPDCASSLLLTDKELLGFSFPGRLSNTECGTSFSAPRVAWLIAAHEALTPKPQDVMMWKSELYKKLIGIRDKNADGYNKIRLNIQTLFDDVSN